MAEIPKGAVVAEEEEDGPTLELPLEALCRALVPYLKWSPSASGEDRRMILVRLNPSQVTFQPIVPDDRVSYRGVQEFADTYALLEGNDYLLFDVNEDVAFCHSLAVLDPPEDAASG